MEMKMDSSILFYSIILYTIQYKDNTIIRNDTTQIIGNTHTHTHTHAHTREEIGKPKRRRKERGIY